mgnify:CR=1 FL=1
MTTIPMSSSHSSHSSHAAIDWAALAKKVPLAVAFAALLFASALCARHGDGEFVPALVGVAVMLAVVMTWGNGVERQRREPLRRTGLNRWSMRRTFLWRRETLEN